MKEKICVFDHACLDEAEEKDTTGNKSASVTGLCALDLKAWLRATRVESKVGDDPFILYQQGIMTKGALLEVIVNEVEAYLKKRA